jgi:hypothetical protein
MSLHKLAKKVQSTGRGRDSMLVHMSPREVRGLQQLARIKGGALTTNPETGLPEAGFLEDILPMVAAGAAIYFTAGAATPMLMSAGMGATSAGILAGAGSGALIGAGSAAIQGGDVGQAALMGGATGALGGAISGLGGAGTPTPPTGVEGVASQTAGTSAVAANAPVAQATQVGTQAINVNPATGSVIDPLAAAPTPVPGAQGGAPLSSPQFSPITPAQAGQMTSADVAGLDRLAAQQGVFAEGAYQLPTQSPTAVSPPMNEGQRIMKQQADAVAAAQKDPNASWWSKQTPVEKAGYSTLGAGLVAGLNAPPGSGGVSPEEDYTSSLQRISPNFRAQEPIQPNPYYRARYPTYAAGGGLMDAYQAGGPVERMSMMNTAMNPQGGLYPQGMIDKTQYATPTQRPVSAELMMDAPAYERSSPMLMARGGIADLGGYSDGGRMLKGPGDGMSDSIPGVIANKQPARLADGEFVVPADVVSHLGNGSTDAGAKRLYAMMAKVRKARTGKKKQAPAVNTARFLPA